MPNFQDTFETHKRSFVSVYSICMTLPLSQITEAEISKIISSLNSTKSTGPNNIPMKILKLLQV